MNNRFDPVIARAGEVILGKEHQIRLALTCLLARGHLLIEDLPGMGKTTLAHVLAATLGLRFSRVQFTSDLLPADILGVSIYRGDQGSFEFHPGPIFSQLLLADEVNRATPKTQSALLEAMEEQQVTSEGETRPLPQPFFVIATQNPIQQIGTFPLPESQLDRFLMRVELGYPDPAAEHALLAGKDRRRIVQTITPCLDIDELQQAQHQADQVRTSDALLDYVQALLRFSRESPHFDIGLSPRGGLALVRCSRAWAFLAGRNYVVPEDVQAVLPYVASHRLQMAEGSPDGEALGRIFQEVPVP